ncbi:MAG: hypothetical protein DHS20C02_06810 [Micavibrio sp.]|nr:MAG: hypothetical protein DHS20C02_06810 [Micavibrio sp.]
MANNIVLGSSLKDNLLSIVNTQRALDRTTLRLATGLKVNSALDNPQNFFAAHSLDSRASDLQRLLDGIGQSVQTIKEAEIGTQALSKLIEQADSVAQQAVELTGQTPTEGRLVGDVDLRSLGDLTSQAGINVGDQLVFSFRDPDTILPYFPVLRQVTFAAGDTADSLVANINAINNVLPEPAIRASLTKNGSLEISSINGDILNVEFDAAGATPDSTNLALANQLGFGDVAQLLGDGFGQNEVQATVVAGRQLTSFQLFDTATNRVAQRSDRLSQLEGANNTLLFFGLNAAADTFQIGVDGGQAQSIVIDGNRTIQGLIDAINNNPSLSNSLEADFNEETGQLIIRAIDPTVESIETGLSSNAITLAFFGFNVGAPIYLVNTDTDSIRLGSVAGPAAEQIAQLESDYDNILEQIDGIAEDAHFRGINLLKEDDLVTFFNEDRNNSLITEGVDFTASGLGFDTANFNTNAGAVLAVGHANAALNVVRDFGQSIANDLSVVQTRRSFTEKTINTLKAGADDLTVADQNKEGANLLAVQTRQALAVTVLSLVGQQQSAILRIF